MLLLALLLSLAALIQFTVVTRTVVDVPIRADAADYFAYAQNLHDHGTFSRSAPARRGEAPPRDHLRSPGYPVFLLLAGAPQPDAGWLLQVSLMQAALGVLSVLLSYAIAHRLGGGTLAMACALVVAINPYLAMSNVYLLTESLFTFLLLASAWLSLRSVDAPSRLAPALLAGLAWGLCSLVRPTMQFLPALMLVATLLLPGLRAWHRPAAIALAVFALVVAPWALRNRTLPPAPPNSDLMVNSIVHGSYPGFKYDDRPETFAFPYRFDPRIQEISRDLPTALGHIASEFRRQPMRMAKWYLVGKPYFFLSLRDAQSLDVMIYPVLRAPWYEDIRFAAVREASRLLHWPLTLSALAAMGLLLLWPRALRLTPEQRWAASLVAMVIAYAIALHMVAAPFPRYAIPFRPLIYALGLLPLRAAWLWLRAARAVPVGSPT